jgi:hypothetical protein
LLVVILNLLVYNIPAGVCGCRAAPSDAPESASAATSAAG